MQVAWERGDGSKAPQFYSVSSDGRVLLWALRTRDLEPETAMTLKLASKGEAEAPNELAGGTCFDFNAVRTFSVSCVC